MTPAAATLRRTAAALMRDPLRRNAYALVLGTGITSAMGLGFWALAARVLDTVDVGVGAALLSAVTLLANLATLGLRNGLVRFLPNAGLSARRLILSSYALCGAAAAAAAGIFLAGQPLWAGDLAFLRSGPAAAGVFVAGSAVWVVFVLQDHVLVGLRRSMWVPVENAFSSLLKIAALPACAAASAWAIFAATLLPAALVVALVTAWIMWCTRVPRRRGACTRDGPRVPLRALAGFAAWDHVATLLWMCTPQVLVLIVLQQAGAEASAYFFMANTIGYAFYVITSNIGSALIAETAHDPAHAGDYARAALSHSARLVLPLVGAGMVLAPWVLRVLGPGYADHAALALRLIILSAVPQMIVGVSVSTARASRRMRLVFSVYAATAAGMWAGGWVGVHWWGITGVGAAYLLTQAAIAAVLVRTGRTGLSLRRPVAPLLRAAAVLLPPARRRLRNSRELGSRLPAALACTRLPDDTETLLLTSDSDTLVLSVAPSSRRAVPQGAHSPASEVLKIATSCAASRGLDRHADALLRLRPALDPGMRALVPCIVRRGSAGGQRVLVESRLPGASVAGCSAVSVAAPAASALARIHAATAHTRTIDGPLLDSWVNDPIAHLRQRCGTWSGYGPERLDDALRNALMDRSVLVGVVHGDFWAGNVLIGGTARGAGTVRITGIVDWEDARPEGLHDVDLVHWWLAAQPGALGRTVCAALDDPGRVRKDLSGDGIRLTNPDVPIECAVLLAWLWHVSATTTRAEINRLGCAWTIRNVYPVLRRFGPGAARPITRAE